MWRRVRRRLSYPGCGGSFVYIFASAFRPVWPGRCILVAAADLPGARSFIPSLKRLIKDSYDQRHRATLPYQYTDELLLWAYLDGKQHAMFWLSLENNETDPFSPVLRHCQSAVPIHTCILPGMQFFDALRMAPTMPIDPLEYDDLESFDGEFPPCEKWELRAQSNERTDTQLVAWGTDTASTRSKQDQCTNGC